MTDKLTTQQKKARAALERAAKASSKKPRGSVPRSKRAPKAKTIRETTKPSLKRKGAVDKPQQTPRTPAKRLSGKNVTQKVTGAKNPRLGRRVGGALGAGAMVVSALVDKYVTAKKKKAGNKSSLSDKTDKAAIDKALKAEWDKIRTPRPIKGAKNVKDVRGTRDIPSLTKKAASKKTKPKMKTVTPGKKPKNWVTGHNLKGKDLREFNEREARDNGMDR